MTEDPEKREWAVRQLREKAAGLGRLPKKEDFCQADRSRIKAFLGPWPRALEAAGLKPARVEHSKAQKTNGEKENLD